MARDKIRIRKARSSDIQQIFKVLSHAFRSYQQYYTEEAYRATVTSPHEIRKRIAEKETVVLVATQNSQIVGTVSITTINEENLHVQSMAVEPDHQGRGVGWLILQEIDELARKGNCRAIILECFEPLTKAVSLYEESGFRRTGRKRSLYGSMVFEMMKRMEI